MKITLPPSIFVWGGGEHGCLGLGGRCGLGSLEIDRHEPTLLDTCPDANVEWTHIACGKTHTAALTKKGEVYTWGKNHFGQLGYYVGGDSYIPTKVSSLSGIIIIQISCGWDHTAALSDKGEVFTWGDGDGELGLLGYHNDENFDEITPPTKVEALSDQVIVEVACGCYHTCAFTSTGAIYTWGSGVGTGHGDGGVILLPRLLDDLSSKGVICASTFYKNVAFVTKAGELYTCGDEYLRGNLGHGYYHGAKYKALLPKFVEALAGIMVKTVSCGTWHTAVCTDAGLVYTFGRSEYGKLGHGDTDEDKFAPVLVRALVGRHITQVQCGENNTMALTSSGYVFTWGCNENGQLGHGSRLHNKLISISIPCLVERLCEHNVIQISSGSHSAVLVDPSPSPIRQSQQASFNNKQCSDVVFMVENRPLYANVDILSQKSDYFAAMFRSNMRESLERVVQVPNCSKAALLRVLEYLCLDDFIMSIDDAVGLWQLADMYQLEGLKYFCMSALERGLCKENVSQILEEVEGLDCPCDELKSICRQYLVGDCWRWSET